MKLGTKLLNTIYLGESKNVFNPTLIEVVPNQKFTWLGSLYFKSFFSGRHYFEIQEIEANKVKLIHGEDFTGLISGLVFNKIADKTKAGFISMNEALKLKCEEQ